eukprot:Stramenopile-MAST_4_protein_190
MQINGSLPIVFQVKWPLIYLKFLSKIDIFSMDFISFTGMTCADGVDFNAKFLGISSAPILVVLIAALLYWRGKRGIEARFQNLSEEARRKCLASSYSNAISIANTSYEGDMNANEVQFLIEKVLEIGNVDIVVIEDLLVRYGKLNKSKVRTISETNFSHLLQTKKLMKILALYTDVEANNRLLVRLNKDIREEVHARTFFYKDTYRKHAVNAIEILLLLHTPVTRKVFEFFNCQEIGGRLFMKADYSIECWSPSWIQMLPIVLAVLIAFTIGLPVFLGRFLLKNRSKLFTVEVYSNMGFLYNRYRHGTEFWNIHEMRLASRIASFPTLAVANAKRSIMQVEEEKSMEKALVGESYLFAELMNSAQTKGRMELFLERGGQTRQGERRVAELLAPLPSKL